MRYDYSANTSASSSSISSRVTHEVTAVLSCEFHALTSYIITRKLCYRKDDRAMQYALYMGALKISGTP